jgi:hypothetical protein
LIKAAAVKVPFQYLSTAFPGQSIQPTLPFILDCQSVEYQSALAKPVFLFLTIYWRLKGFHIILARVDGRPIPFSFINSRKSSSSTCFARGFHGPVMASVN